MRRIVSGLPRYWTTIVLPSTTRVTTSSTTGLTSGPGLAAGFGGAGLVSGPPRASCGAHPPQEPPPRQWAHFEQFLHAVQLALPVQRPAKAGGIHVIAK